MSFPPSLMLLQLQLLLLLTGVTLLQALNVKPCSGGASSGNILEVRVSDCSHTPCKLVRGKEVTIEFDFTLANEEETLSNSINAVIFGGKVAFKGTDSTSACNDVSPSPACPASPDTTYTYRKVILVRKEFPAVSVNVEYGLTNKDKKMLVCFTMPVRIANDL